MSVRRRKPGRLFWLWTFAIGIVSPDKGRRRIAADRAADKSYIQELEGALTIGESNYHLLMQKLANSVAEGNDLRSRLEMADGIRELNKVKAAARTSTTMPLRAPAWAQDAPPASGQQTSTRITTRSAESR